jgi:hypothetical protein
MQDRGFGKEVIDLVIRLFGDLFFENTAIGFWPLAFGHRFWFGDLFS